MGHMVVSFYLSSAKFSRITLILNSHICNSSVLFCKANVSKEILWEWKSSKHTILYPMEKVTHPLITNVIALGPVKCVSCYYLG